MAKKKKDLTKCETCRAWILGRDGKQESIFPEGEVELRLYVKDGGVRTPVYIWCGDAENIYLYHQDQMFNLRAWRKKNDPV